MTKPASYPFLAIAKAHDADYGDVLAFAAWISDRAGYDRRTEALSVYAKDDICRAVKVQQDIRDGVIDWQTGLQPASHFNPANHPEWSGKTLREPRIRRDDVGQAIG